MRVLIAVTHLLGAGHLTRAAALARGLDDAGHETVLVTGGRNAPLVRFGGARLVALPALHIAGTAFSKLLCDDGSVAGEAFLALRRRRLLDLVEEVAPDVLVTELFPFGRRALAAEFLALVEATRARRPRPLILASIRDILVAPDNPAKIRQAHERVAALYDAVLVHGDPALVPLAASWPIDPALGERIHQTGYIDEGAAVVPAAHRHGVLVSAGSSDAGLGLFQAAAQAARTAPELGWRILVGHGVPDSTVAAIGADLPDGVVARAHPDYRHLLAQAALSVSQCGYNTAVDLLATGTRAVFVPFEAGAETEQRLRAERLAARGLGQVLPEAEVTPETLLACVTSALAAPAPAAHGVRLDGAERSVALIQSLAARRPGVPARGPSGLDRLRAALDRAAERGAEISVWWRDDDAVAATPELDRLLDLAASVDAPILIAAIPAGIDPSLPDRLRVEERISLAVHGLSHANHASPGARSAEFGRDRPHAVLVAEAADALHLARRKLAGARLLPVFVPPWNRLDHELAEALPSLGYVGLSASPGAAVAGLARVDPQIDPIDWRGTRSLLEPERIVGRIVEAVAEAERRPVGLLTHHLAHDARIWAFLERLLPVLMRHPAVRVRDPRTLFDPSMDAAAIRWPGAAAGDRARAS